MNHSSRATTAVPWRWGALLVTTAFVVKLIVLWQLRDHPLLQPHGELDTAYYVALSQRIAREGVLAPIGAFFVSPLYVYFLAAVFAAGGTLFATQLIQIGLGAAASPVKSCSRQRLRPPWPGNRLPQACISRSWTS